MAVSPDRPDRLDIVAMVRDDHRRFRRMLDQMSDATDHRPALARLRTELGSHAAAEEAVLYPALVEVLTDGVRQAHQSTYEHVRIGETLDALDQPGVVDRAELLDRLSMELRFHMDREEAEWLEVLDRRLTPNRRRELAEQFRRLRRPGTAPADAGVALIRRDASGTVGGG
ncbi:MAG: hemerythrin domain-containing protein [Acidimicrobiales bacterium]